MIVAHHDDTMQAGACRAAAGKLVEHLSGSARSNDGGRWPIVVDPSDKSGDDPLLWLGMGEAALCTLVSYQPCEDRR